MVNRRGETDVATGIAVAHIEVVGVFRLHAGVVGAGGRHVVGEQRVLQRGEVLRVAREELARSIELVDRTDARQRLGIALDRLRISGAVGLEERLGALKLDAKILHARVDRKLVHREFVLGVKHMGRGAVVPVKRLQVGAVVEGRAQGGINHRVP